MSGAWKIEALKLVPKNLVSRAFGVAADIKMPPPVQRIVNTTFASLAGIDVQESEHTPDHYESLNKFFTRSLKPDARRVESSDPNDVVSPVDGRVGSFGKITDNTLIQAKGRTYKLHELVDCPEEALDFANGHFLTIYLSPKDYHRIHSPVTGDVDKVSYIPGYLFPVNAAAVENVENLFAVNERLISYITTERLGRTALVKVGATCVGRIGLTFNKFVTNQRFRERVDIDLSDNVHLEHGSEMAVFNLGSTVILLISQPEFKFHDTVKFGEMLSMGQLIGTATDS